MDLSMKGMSLEEAERVDAVLGFNGKYRFLSNFWQSPIRMYGILFPTVEHAFAAAKIDPKNPRGHDRDPYEMMREIAAMKTPAEAKRAGRRVLLRRDWEEKKVGMILELVRRKFADQTLRKMLLATGDRPLIELNTWNDRTWGMVEKNGALMGKNFLGEILMLVRSEIRD